MKILALYVINEIDMNLFLEKTDRIVKILNEIKELKTYYIDRQKGCFASMTRMGKKYIAISETFHDNKYKESIINILGTEYELIILDIKKLMMK